jgi:carboxypeptidase Taq
MSAYAALEKRFARLAAIEDAGGILGWDKEALMPLGAAERRAESMAALAVIAHDLLTAPDTAAEIAGAGEEALSDWQRANLAEIARIHAHATAVPADLVEALSRATSRCEVAWRAARAASDFPALLPLLQEVLDRVREAGQAKGEALGLSPYDALLDQYDPGTRQAEIDPVFAGLRAGLPALIAAALERQAARPAPLPVDGPFPAAIQRALGETLMRTAGFDGTRGRLDVSTHPFCGGATDDVRITTRYDETDFSSALMGVLHETGHALYEQGRPRDWLGQPVGAARGMSLHESQSLLVEMQACRSLEFAQFLAPKLRDAFGKSGPAWTPENLHALNTRVRPGFIRVDADEVTYPAHILLRYELEKAMIAGDLALRDLPGAFNDGISSLLGLTVPDDRHGCLQDIHWPGGSFGYFPTYTMGALIAAQLFDAAKRAEPGLLAAIAQGDFTPLLRWLRQHVHGRGSVATTTEIVRAATGRPLDAAIYQAHLKARYLGE